MQLFRARALSSAEMRRAFGRVVLIRPARLSIYVGALLLGASALLVLLSIGTYTSKTTVKGIVMPESGMRHIFAPYSGTIIDSSVEEGAQVSRADPLFVISTEKYLENRENVQMATTAELSNSIDRIKTQIFHRGEYTELQTRNTLAQIDTIEEELSLLDNEIDLQTQKLESHRKDLSRISKAADRGVVTETARSREERALLGAQLEKETLVRLRTTKTGKLDQLRAKLEELPLQLSSAQAELEEQLSELRKQLIIAKSDSRHTLISPADGTAAAVRYSVGDTVQAGSSMLAILPRDHKLEATLYVPTHAAGFIEKGQKVLLKYDAFPFHRFGFGRGVVRQVSNSVVLPETSSSPISFDGPVYLVKVTIDEPFVRKNGKAHRLQTGMLLTADIVRGKERIVELLIGPISDTRLNKS